MTELETIIEASVKSKKLLRDGQSILVAVSGGVDSMVLLAVLGKLAKAHRWKLSVAHFNHQLRGKAADADERFVRRSAKALKLRFVSDRGNVREFARNNGVSLEMAARKLRHDFLAGTARKLKIRTIALAHHADDQVELFLMRLLRGAGGEGLAGMKPSNPSPSNPTVRLIRPLLDVSKAELRRFATENKIAFREDASNASLDIRRNRIRHELIPILTSHYQPGLTRNLLRVMALVGAEAELAAAMARDWLRAQRKAPFSKLAIAVQRRVIHQQLASRKLVPEFELIERLRLNAGLWITANSTQCVKRNTSGLVELRLSEPAEFTAERRALWLPKQRREATFGGVKIRWAFADGSEAERVRKESGVEWFDAGKVGKAICLRRWQPGDRFQPIGMGSAKKLQDLFTDLKVPRAERHQRIVATTREGELFWVEGLRMAEKFKLDDRTVQRLEWRWQRPAGPPLS